MLTDAERETVTHSNRFAGHILRQHQFANLAHPRNWQYRLMGAFDSFNTPYLVLPKWDLTAEFWVESPEGNEFVSDHMIYTIIFTEQLCFTRDGERLPLTEIMPLVFSEVMRDVDLFVSVDTVFRVTF